MFSFFYVVDMPSNTMPIFETLDLGLIATSKPLPPPQFHGNGESFGQVTQNY